jgi:DNA transposition AAA+ family ATPase
MTETGSNSKGIAGLRNVSAMIQLLGRLDQRSDGMAGIGVYYGFPGWGKTTAAVYCTLQSEARLVTAAPYGGKKFFCEALKVELGLTKGGTVASMMEEIIEALVIAGKPLIIDEADYLVREGMLDLVRHIHDMSNVPVTLIGMEKLPIKLAKFEQFHSRVLYWVKAEPATLEDAKLLAPIYAPDATVEDGLIEAINRHSGGSLRRMANNLDRVNQLSFEIGRDVVTEADWGKRAFDTGVTPQARRGFK